MTTINDLESRISSAEATLEYLKADLQALKNQEPEQESLLGRWATLPKHGRGIITSIKPDSNGEVRFIYRNEIFTDSTEWLFASVEHLTLDPVTLNGEQDFENAPEGTIVQEFECEEMAFMKSDGAWFAFGDTLDWASRAMSPSRVIRWGDGK